MKVGINNVLMLVFATISLLPSPLKAQTKLSEPLTPKEQSLVKIAALTTVGNLELLKRELQTGLEAGLTINEINEELIQLYAYCGFPKSLNAINTFFALVNERKSKGIADVQGVAPSSLPVNKSKLAFGTEVQTKLVGKPVSGEVYVFVPGVDTFLKEHLFADIFGRGVLTFQQRELATVSALSVMEGAEGQLKFHLAMGVNAGNTERQLSQAVSLAARITSENSIFPKGQKLPSEWFTGDAFLTPFVTKDKSNEYAAGVVTFDPNARTYWHNHPKVQVLIVIEGSGLYQERGKPARVIKKGDVVNIPENVEHWHGASATSKMAHIAITNYKENLGVTWYKPVSEQEYAKANKL